MTDFTRAANYMTTIRPDLWKTQAEAFETLDRWVEWLDESPGNYSTGTGGFVFFKYEENGDANYELSLRLVDTAENPLYNYDWTTSYKNFGE